MTGAQLVDRPLTGIAWMVAGVLAGVSLDTCAKWLLQTYSLSQFVFVRSVGGFVLLLVIISARGRLGKLRTHQPAWHVLRSMLSLICVGTFFYAIIYMPLADAITIAFAVPIIVTALSTALLKEKVGLPRWCAVLVGFVGVIIAMRPGGNMLAGPMIALLIAVVAYALLAITARTLAFSETAECLAVWVYPASIVATAWPAYQSWVAPDAAGWLLLGLAGAFSALAFVCINAAYRHAKASIVVPFEYTALVWATLAGWVFWRDLPDRWVVGGACVIIGSGLFILYRESRVRVRPNTFPVQDVSVSRVSEDF